MRIRTKVERYEELCVAAAADVLLRSTEALARSLAQRRRRFYTLRRVDIIMMMIASKASQVEEDGRHRQETD